MPIPKLCGATGNLLRLSNTSRRKKVRSSTRRPGHPPPASLDKRRQWILTGLDLEPIIIKAMDSEEGYGWTFAFADRVADEYRRFLILCLEHRQDSKYLIVPSKLVDKFWHLHILDTRKYIEDCQYCFGSMLHHFPYFGMRGDQDAANLREAWSRTLALYQSTFNVEPPAEIWPHSKSEIGIRYRDVKREDANPAHRRFDCRRPRLADLERLNGTSRRFEAVKVRLPKWNMEWKRLVFSPIHLSLAFAAVLILAVGSSASSNNASVVLSDSSGLIIVVWVVVIYLCGYGLLDSKLRSHLCNHTFLEPFFVSIYAKLEANDDYLDYIKRYPDSLYDWRYTVTSIPYHKKRKGYRQTVKNYIKNYIKDRFANDKNIFSPLYLYYLSSEALRYFVQIYTKVEAIQDNHSNQYGKRLTITELQQNHVIENAIDSYIESLSRSRSSGGGACSSGGGCGGGGCGG